MMNFKSKSRVCLLVLFISIISIGESQTYFNHTVSFSHFPWVFDSGMNAVETDSGYVINGATTDPILYGWGRIGMLELDKTGEVLIKKNWGDTISIWYNNNRKALIKKGNNYYTIGSKRSYYGESSHSELMMIKYDINLDTVWSQCYGKKTYPYDTSYIGRSFIETENGFVIVAAVYPNNTNELYANLLKSDTLGNIIWEKWFGDQNYYFQGYSVIQTSDNGYAIGGYRFVFGLHGVTIGDPIILKTDSLGNEEWRYNMGSQYQDGIPTVCQTEDGNILAVARYDIDSIYDDLYKSRIRYLELTNDGEIVQDKLIGKKVYYLTVENCRIVEGNGLIICGSLWSSFPAHSGYIYRLGNEADSLWYRQYTLDSENNGTNYFRDAISTSDGGFLGVGTSNYDGDQKVWVVKVDSLGCESEWDCWVGEQEWQVPEKTKASIRIYPNPARGKFTIGTLQPVVGSQKMQVFDLYGRRVEEVEIPKGQTETEINVTGWKKGLYVVRVNNKDGLIGRSKVLVE